MCGYDTTTQVVTKILNGTKTFDMPVSIMNIDYKCTWVVNVANVAPVFELKNIANASTKGITTSNL
jgi:hypothetical protein